MSRLQWPAVCVEAEKWLPYLESNWPEFIEEMKGVAVGADTDFPSILALNTRTELAYGLSYPEVAKRLDGCTALSYHSIADGAAFLAQNWDWFEEQASNLVHLKIRNPAESHRAPHLSFVSEAGIIGKIGLNSYGIGTCLNAVRAPGVNYNRLPVHLALRAALDCDITKLQQNVLSNGHASKHSSASANGISVPTARAAAAILQTAGVASAAHILIADAHEGIGLETSCEEVQQVPVTRVGEARAVLHTNHFVATSHSVPDDKNHFPDSQPRLQRIDQLVSSTQGICESTIDGFLKDEQDYPSSICRDVDPKVPSTVITIFSIVMDLQNRRAHVKVGRPVKPTLEFDIQAVA